MHIGPPDSGLYRPCAECSVTRMREWLCWCGAQKNGLWHVRVRSLSSILCVSMEMDLLVLDNEPFFEVHCELGFG